jgi:copper chaperone CopZ
MKQLLAFIILITLSSVAFSQVEQIKAKVENISCSLCFTLAQASLKQLPGVTNVSADAKSGLIEIQSSSGVSVRDVMDRVAVAGFKKGNSFEVSVQGKLEKRGNRIVLAAPGQKELFIVEQNSRSQMAANIAQENSRVKIVASISGSGNQYNLNVVQMRKQD